MPSSTQLASRVSQVPSSASVVRVPPLNQAAPPSRPAKARSTAPSNPAAGSITARSGSRSRMRGSSSASSMDPPPKQPSATETSFSGRSRSARTITTVLPHLDWPGVAQVGRIERDREIRGQTSREVAYAVTSLTRELAGPEELLSLFGVTSLSLILGSVVSARLSTAQAPSRRIIAVCLALMVVSAGCALAVAWIGPVRLFTIMPPIAVIVFCFGLLAPTVTHEAIRPLPDIAGAAAGVLRSLQMLVGAGAGALVTLIVDYTRPPLAMACIMVASALGALTIYIALLGWSERDRGP